MDNIQIIIHYCKRDTHVTMIMHRVFLHISNLLFLLGCLLLLQCFMPGIYSYFRYYVNKTKLEYLLIVRIVIPT